MPEPYTEAEFRDLIYRSGIKFTERELRLIETVIREGDRADVAEVAFREIVAPAEPTQ